MYFNPKTCLTRGSCGSALNVLARYVCSCNTRFSVSVSLQPSVPLEGPREPVSLSHGESLGD